MMSVGLLQFCISKARKSSSETEAARGSSCRASAVERALVQGCLPDRWGLGACGEGGRWSGVCYA